MVKNLKSFFRFCNRCVIAAAVIFCLIFIRLAYGPTPVSFLGETIKEPFEAAFPGKNLDFDGVYLSWNMDNMALEFSLDNARLTQAGGETIAAFSSLVVDFDGLNLLVGNFIPERVDIYGAELTFLWSAKDFEKKIEQLFSPTDDEQQEPEEDERPAAIRFMEALLEGEGEDSPLRALKVVNIRNTTVTLKEKASGVVWIMPDASLSLVRTPLGLSLNAGMSLVSEGEEVRVNLRSGNTAEGQTWTDLEVEGLNPARLAEEVGLEGVFQAINMPLYGSVSFWQNAGGGISLVAFDIGGGPGTIFYEPFHPSPAAFEDMILKGVLDPAENLVSIDLIRLSVDQAIIEGDGFLEFEADQPVPAVRMHFRADNLKISTLLKLWPPVPHSGGRVWLEQNVTSGTLNNLEAEVAFTPEIWETRPLPDQAMNVTMDFADGEIHFLRPMSPLENVFGTLTINGNRLTAAVHRGEVYGLPITDIFFEIEDLTVSQQQMGFATIRLEGDLQRILRLVDQEPLQVFSKHGLDPGDYFGRVSGVARLEVPLYQGAPVDEEDYTIEATIYDAAVPELISQGGLTEGTITMTVTPSGLVATGNGLLRGAPFDFYWTQDFIPSETEAYSTRIEISGNVSDQNLHRFGLPEDLTMEGTARVYMSMRGIDGELKTGQGTLDFFNARISAGKMDWYKDANRPAEGSFDLEWTGDEFHVRNVRLRTRELTFNGAFIFDAESGLMKRADVPLFISGRHDLTATARQRPDGVLELTIQARTLNAAPFLETMFEDSPGESFAPNMKMTLLADQVFGMNGVRYTNVSIVAEKRREFWIAANVIGAIDDGGMFQIALDNDQAGRHLTIESDNAGRFGLGVDVFRNAVGGRLMLTADLNIYQTPLYAVGTLAVNDFRMVKSSTLIQALAEDERSGLDEMIREGGVDFKQLLIPFKLEDEVFDISGGSASGPSLGFTMEGQIDQRFERMNINGTVVPAYTLNTIISRIPVIGTILMGGKGEGLFAVNYRVSGTRDDPKVDISEISVLTPGILRKLIGQKKGKLEPEEETTPVEQPTPAEEEPAPAEEPATEEEPVEEGEGEPLPEETPDEGAGEG